MMLENNSFFLVLDLGYKKIVHLTVGVIDTLKMFRFDKYQIIENPVDLIFMACLMTWKFSLIMIW